MEQLTKRQVAILKAGLEALDADLGKDGGFWDELEDDGPPPTMKEIEHLGELIQKPDVEHLTARLRECWVLASDLKKSARNKDWTTEPTLHALVIEYVFVPEDLRERGLAKGLIALMLEQDVDLVIVEGAQNEHLYAYLTAEGWPCDPTVKDFYYPRSDEAEAAVKPFNQPKPRITDYEQVVNAMLLTDMCLDLGDYKVNIPAVEEAVRGWTDDERAAAFEWAACSHLAAGDNDDVVVPPTPPHVEKLRPKYGSKK